MRRFKSSKAHRAKNARPVRADVRMDEYDYAVPTQEREPIKFAPWRIVPQMVFTHEVPIKPVSFVKEVRTSEGTESQFGANKYVQRVFISNGVDTLSLTVSFAPVAKRNVKRWAKGPDGKMRLTGCDALTEALLHETQGAQNGAQTFEQSSFAIAELEPLADKWRKRQTVIRRGMAFDVPELPIGDLCEGKPRVEKNRESHTLESFERRITQIGGAELAREVVAAMRSAF